MTVAATIAATHVNTQAGEWVHVEMPHGAAYGRAASFDAQALEVLSDEHGSYFRVEWDDHVAGVRWASIANTIVDVIVKIPDPA